MKILAILVIASGFAHAAPALQELKRHDFSILLKNPQTSAEDPTERCFLLPAVNEALSRVQEKMRLHHSRLKITRCYEPADARYGKGAVVHAEVVDGRATTAHLLAAFRKEGFRQAGKGKGIFVHEASENSEIQKTPVAELR